jgi:hypothetical protein
MQAATVDVKARIFGILSIYDSFEITNRLIIRFEACKAGFLRIREFVCPTSSSSSTKLGRPGV